MTELERKAWSRPAYVRKPCKFTDCGRAHYARGLCNGHYQQWRRRDVLKPLPAVPPKKPRAKAVRPCKFDGCERLNYGGGLCSTHYMQRRRGFELKPIRQPRPDAAEGFAWCGKCKQFVDETEFSWDFQRNEHRYWCRSCMGTAQHDYTERTGGHEAYLLRKRLKRRNITAAQYERLLAEQCGKCAICGQPGQLDIDHCHATQAVRGLLCGSCNRALGLMRDSVAVLRGAIEYLERSGQPRSTGG